MVALMVAANGRRYAIVGVGVLFGKFWFVCRLFERLANVYDCEALAWCVVSIILQFFCRTNKSGIQ